MIVPASGGSHRLGYLPLLGLQGYLQQLQGNKPFSSGLDGEEFIQTLEGIFARYIDRLDDE
jgi:hypothetical protein